MTNDLINCVSVMNVKPQKCLERFQVGEHVEIQGERQAWRTALGEPVQPGQSLKVWFFWEVPEKPDMRSDS